MGCCQAPENRDIRVSLLSETDESFDPVPPDDVTLSYQQPVAQPQPVIQPQTVTVTQPNMTETAGVSVTINAQQDAQAQQVVNQQMNEMGHMMNELEPEMGAMFQGTQAMMNISMAANANAVQPQTIAAQTQPNNVSVSVHVSHSHNEPNAVHPFTAPYQFAKRNTVVIQHRLGKFLRVKPGALGQLDPNGATGDFAQWEAEPLNGGKEVKLKSMKSGKYLRIDGQSRVNAGGSGGDWTVFVVHNLGGGKVKLESKQLRGKYVAVQQDNVIRVGSGGKWTEMNIYRNPSIHVVMNQPTTTVTEVAANETCPKCNGNGFVHESSMDHKTGDPNKKCFFCESCKGCNGTGSVMGTKKIISSTDAFGNSTVQTVDSVKVCAGCNGKGWKHISGMEHKTGDPNKKCFFCDECQVCGGTGR